jgi:geranylgeranyl pyrophosphate synthase
LWALALEALPAAGQAELLQLAGDANLPVSHRLARVRALYHEAGVFEKAHRLVDKHQQRAEAIADELQPEELRRLLYYLIDTVLDRPTGAPPPPPPAVTPTIVPLTLATLT